MVAKWPGGGFMGFCFTCTMDEMILFDSFTNNGPFESTNYIEHVAIGGKTERKTRGNRIRDDIDRWNDEEM